MWRYLVIGGESGLGGLSVQEYRNGHWQVCRRYSDIFPDVRMAQRIARLCNLLEAQRREQSNSHE